jgi:protease PrsW
VTADAGTRERLVRALFAVALVFAGACAFGLVIDVFRPRHFPSEPLVGLLSTAWPDVPKVVVVSAIGSWFVALWWWLVWVTRRRPLQRPAARVAEMRRLQLRTAIVLLLPFTVLSTAMLFGQPVALLACLPTTALALWAVSRMQRYRRVPGWLLLAAAGWGAFIGYGFGGTMNMWVLDNGATYLFGTGAPGAVAQTINVMNDLSAGVFEELGKGAAVAVAYLAFRRYFDGVVSGIVIGAAVGLGTNFVESIEYMTSGNGAAFEFWTRQSVGIMAAHVAFTAMIGAGFGVARQLKDRRLRLIAIGCGYLCAVGGHFANDALIPWVGAGWRSLFPPNRVLDTLLVTPLTLAVLQGPIVVLYVVLLRKGLRSFGAGIGDALRAEAASGSGAVREDEIPILLAPKKRLVLRIVALRRYGWAGYRALVRVQAAQYDLAAERWHRSRGESDKYAPSEAELRDGVLRAKERLSALVRVPA